MISFHPHNNIMESAVTDPHFYSSETEAQGCSAASSGSQSWGDGFETQEPGFRTVLLTTLSHSLSNKHRNWRS